MACRVSLFAGMSREQLQQALAVAQNYLYSVKHWINGSLILLHTGGWFQVSHLYTGEHLTTEVADHAVIGSIGYYVLYPLFNAVYFPMRNPGLL